MGRSAGTGYWPKDGVGDGVVNLLLNARRKMSPILRLPLSFSHSEVGKVSSGSLAARGKGRAAWTVLHPTAPPSRDRGQGNSSSRFAAGSHAASGVGGTGVGSRRRRSRPAGRRSVQAARLGAVVQRWYHF